MSLATGQERISSVSNTSLRAARRPPNRRVENHKNSGSPPTGGRPRRPPMRPRGLPPAPPGAPRSGAAGPPPPRPPRRPRLAGGEARRPPGLAGKTTRGAAARLGGEQDPDRGPHGRAEQDPPEPRPARGARAL